MIDQNSPSRSGEFKGRGGEGFRWLRQIAWAFLLGLFLNFSPSLSLEALNCLSPHTKTHPEDKEVTFNQKILSRIWDEEYLLQAIHRKIPSFSLTGDSKVDDLQLRLDKVRRNINHLEEVFYLNRDLMKVLVTEIADTGIFNYIFHLSPANAGDVYRFRQIARALVEASLFTYADQTFPRMVIRLFAYAIEYLTFVYEDQIYQARLSLGDPLWAGRSTYTEWVREDFIERMGDVDLELLIPEGSYMKAYGRPSLDFVVKILQEGVNPELKRAVDFALDIEPKVLLARARLAGLGANTLVLENVPLKVMGRVQVYPKVLIQTRVTPLWYYLSSLAEAAEKEVKEIFGEQVSFRDLTARELQILNLPSFRRMQEVVDEWIQLQRHLWERGVVDRDIKMTYNYGYDPFLKRIVIFDFSHISDKEKDAYLEEWHEDIFDRYRLANAGFLSDLHPSLGKRYVFNMYTQPKFNQFWQKESKSSFERRYPLSDPGILTNIFVRSFETMMQAYTDVDDTLGAIAHEVIGIHQLYDPNHPIHPVFLMLKRSADSANRTDEFHKSLLQGL